jgi:hypothetical protein
MHRTLMIVGFAIGMMISANSSLAEEKDSGPDWTSGELEEACIRSGLVCNAACERSDGFSGQLSESFCKDDCNRSLGECLSSIESRARNNEQMAPPTDAVLDPGSDQPDNGQMILLQQDWELLTSDE